MALEACLQLSTIRACSWKSHKEKISLPLPRSSPKGPVSSLSSQQSSLFSSFFNSQQKYRRRIRLVCDAKNAVDGVTAVDEAGWDNAVSGTGSSSSLVLVEFWAPWCGPCRMIEPVIGELAKDYAGKLACYKVNTDTSPTIATKYGIRSIPTLLFFKDGEKKESVIGAVPKSTLCETIEKYLELS